MVSQDESLDDRSAKKKDLDHPVIDSASPNSPGSQHFAPHVPGIRR